MNAALRQTLVVQPGGVLEIRSPDLPVGATAEVIVLLNLPAVVPGFSSDSPASPKSPEELGWPPGFFERFAGSLPNFPDIEPEGEYEVREEFP